MMFHLILKKFAFEPTSGNQRSEFESNVATLDVTDSKIWNFDSRIFSHAAWHVRIVATAWPDEKQKWHENRKWLRHAYALEIYSFHFSGCGVNGSFRGLAFASPSAAAGTFKEHSKKTKQERKTSIRIKWFKWQNHAKPISSESTDASLPFGQPQLDTRISVCIATQSASASLTTLTTQWLAQDCF